MQTYVLNIQLLLNLNLAFTVYIYIYININQADTLHWIYTNSLYTFSSITSTPILETYF